MKAVKIAAAPLAVALVLVGGSAATALASPASAGARHLAPRPVAPGRRDIHQGAKQASVVYSFGTVGNGFGAKLTQLGHATPNQVSGIPGTVVEIATSNSDSYALTSAGTVWAWGAGSTGELGDGSTTPFSASPVEVSFPPGVLITRLANPMPYDSAIAIDAGGHAWGWGFDWSHTLCLPGTDVLAPTELPLSGVRLATGAGDHSLYLADGKVYACGLGADGELGNGSTADSALPTPVIGLPAQRVQALTSSWQGSGVLMQGGSYYDWGFGKGGQLGDGSDLNSDVPVKVALPAPVRAVSQGGSKPTNGQTIALLADGSVWSWGDGALGQLGDGTTQSSPTPVKVALPGFLHVTTVFSGGDSSYALTRDGAVWSWGGNGYGQLGDGGGPPLLTPAPIRLRLSQLSATASNVAGLAFTGRHHHGRRAGG